MGSWRLRSPAVLPSASRRTRKAGSVVQSESEGLGTGALMSEGRRRCTAQLKQPGKFALLLPFCSIPSLRGLDDTQPHRWGSSSLLNLQIQMLISSWTHPDNDLPATWASLNPVKLAHKINSSTAKPGSWHGYNTTVHRAHPYIISTSPSVSFSCQI